MRVLLVRLNLAVALLAVLTTAAAEVPVPPLTARVTDLTSTLSAKAATALEEKFAAFEARRGNKIVVLMLPTTKPDEIERYAARVFDDWKLSRSPSDSGVLLLIAKDDRRLRVELGEGLHSSISDATAKRIIQEEITPHFKQGDFLAGIVAGTDQIMKLLDANPSASSQAESRTTSILKYSDKGTSMGDVSIWHWLVFFVIVIPLIMVPYCFYCLNIQRALAAIDQEYRQISPGTAWLLLIPLFNMIWIYFLIVYLKDGYVAMSEAGRLKTTSNAGFGIG